jgi:uncharacterized protein (TIGR02466 family)
MTAPWIETSEVVPMFPSLVWKLQVGAAQRAEGDARMLAAIARLRCDLPGLEAGQGWQSAQDLHRHEAFGELAGWIGTAAAGILRFLKIGCDALELTACWANVLAPGAAHRMHSHPNNFLSGVYYLRVAPGSGRINFHDPRSQAGVIRPPVTELTAENTDQVVVAVGEGSLLLFPAFLQHSVDANASDGERISVSFNLMFPDFTENLAKPLW